MSDASDFSDDEELLAHFLEYAASSMEELVDFVSKIEGADDQAEMLDNIYAGAHNLKGMSASFGFSMLTDVAASLCLYMKTRTAPVNASLIQSHVKAMHTIITHKISGDGGEKGKAIVAKLEHSVSERLAEEAAENQTPSI